MAERQESIDYDYIKLLIKTLDKVLEALAHARNFQKRPQGADENLTSESDEVLELLHYLSDLATEDGGKSLSQRFMTELWQLSKKMIRMLQKKLKQ